MITMLQKIKKYEDKEVLIAKLWTQIKNHIDYFKEEGDANDMESLYKEDFADYEQIINNLYNGQSLEKVANSISDLDTAPREELIHFLSEIVNENYTLLKDNCETIEDVKQYMVKNGWKYTEECTGNRYYLSFRKMITFDFKELGKTSEEFSGSFAFNAKDWNLDNVQRETAKILDAYELKEKSSI